MKQFTFSLERIQNYKEQILSKEKVSLTHLTNQERDLEEQIECLITQKETTWSVLQKKQIEGIMVSELQSYQFILQNMTHQLIELNQSIILKQKEIAEQKKVVLALYQELSGLDKLETKQRNEHKVSQQKAWELEVSEQIVRGMHDKKV